MEREREMKMGEKRRKQQGRVQGREKRKRRSGEGKVWWQLAKTKETGTERKMETRQGSIQKSFVAFAYFESKKIFERFEGGPVEPFEDFDIVRKKNGTRGDRTTKRVMK